MKNVSPFIYVKDVDKSLCYYKDVFNAQTEILMVKMVELIMPNLYW